MRESPFNKDSGVAKTQPMKSRMGPAPISPEKVDEDAVKNLPAWKNLLPSSGCHGQLCFGTP